MTPRKTFWVWVTCIITLLCCNGCSLPVPYTSKYGGEFIIGYAEEHPEKKLVRRIIPGIDIHTGAHAGIRLGWSETLSAYPCDMDAHSPKEGEGCSSEWSYYPPFGIRWRTTTGALAYLGWFLFTPNCTPNVDTHFEYQHIIGVQAQIRPQSSLGIGINSGTQFVVPEESSALFVLDFDSKQPCKTCLRSK